MVLIKKGKEPRSLTEYRSQPNSTYEGFRQKDDVRKQLLEEQGYLCAYCMRRISLNSMKIEHWKAQNAEDGTGAEHALEYRNMLGVCLGNLSYPYAAQTCDTHRGNTELFVDPRTPEHIKRIEYDAHGRIYSKDERINRDLDQILNLNGQTTYLKEGRKEAIRTLQPLNSHQMPFSLKRAFIWLIIV